MEEKQPWTDCKYIDIYDSLLNLTCSAFTFVRSIVFIVRNDVGYMPDNAVTAKHRTLAYVKADLLIDIYY